MPTLNEYIRAERGGWAAAAAIKKQATGNIQVEVMSQDRRPIEGQVDVDISWITPDNKQDADNIYFTTKYILDGLVAARVLGDDTRKNVRNISHKVRTVKGHRFALVRLVSVKQAK